MREFAPRTIADGGSSITAAGKGCNCGAQAAWRIGPAGNGGGVEFRLERRRSVNENSQKSGSARASTVDAAEVERFSALASEWWDPRGKMAPLHKFNPVRLGYIRDQTTARFGRDPKQLGCLKGLRILDIGCGGGILSRAAGAARRRRGRAPILRRPISRRRSCTPRRRTSRSTTAAPPRRSWRRPANTSTSCWRWRWSSTWPM